MGTRSQRATVNTIQSLIASFSLMTADDAVAQNSGMHLTGAEFLSACTRADMEWISFCNGYVQAIFDGVRRPGEDFCAPPGTTRTMIVEAVVDRLTASPETHSLSAAGVVYAVLLTTFPCR